MIEPRLLTLQDMFSGRVHYEVPIYQRPYVWSEDEQWRPLWDDVRDVADRRLAGHAGALAHFLGAIVIELVEANPGFHVYSVIDGQQRVTTLQLLLAALRDVIEEFDGDAAADLEALLYNDGRHAEGHKKFKVAPSGHDRPAFEAVISGSDGAAGGSAGIPGAYLFFKQEVRAWLVATGDEHVAARLDALLDTLEGLIHVVSIRLDGTSDAQVVFETLNSRGADLTSLDLVKNTLLQQARREGDDPGELHSASWEPALGDTDYWLEEVRQGRYTRERSDLFLMHWLTMRTGKPARVQHLFADFRKEILSAEEPPRAKELVEAVSRGARLYRSFDDFDPASVEGTFFLRLAQMDTTTLLPVALLLFDAAELSVERRQRALRALESWLVRRMVLGATTQHYNRLLASLLATLHAQPTYAQADDVVLDALRGFTNPTDRWPDDLTIVKRLIEQPLYGYVNTRRVRMLLSACEDRIADSNKVEGIVVPAGLTVEHALPQNWRKHWDPPIPEGAQQEEVAEIERRRESRVHVLGNLTLISHALNASLSDSPWDVKRIELAKHGQLLINQRLCANEVWNEDRIDERGATLAGYIVATWPGPDAPWT